MAARWRILAMWIEVSSMLPRRVRVELPDDEHDDDPWWRILLVPVGTTDAQVIEMLRQLLPPEQAAVIVQAIEAEAES